MDEAEVGNDEGAGLEIAGCEEAVLAVSWMREERNGSDFDERAEELS